MNLFSFLITFLMFFLFLPISFASNERCPEKTNDLLIPYVQVTSFKDFYYCFGYLHGRDRAWQMDYFRRTAQGQNAEVLGYTHIKSDLMMRLLDLPKHAQKLWKDMTLENQSPWLDYTEGVNAGFIQGKNAKEFQIAGFEPAAWKPEDSLLVLLLQSFDQTRKTFFKDYEEQRALEKHGEQAKELFSVEDLPWADTILHDGEYPRNELLKKTSEVQKFDSTSPSLPKMELPEFPSLFGLEAGSNNWVVSKNKSKNKVAMLANDPHLNLKTPLFWYWLNVTIDGKNKVMGGSLPGVPIIISGTNGKVAWGLTNAYINTADAAFIDNLPKDEVETIRPWVWFKFGPFKLPFFFKSFSRTKSGDVILPLEVESKLPMLLRWSGFFLKGEDVPPMLKLFETQNVDEMNVLLKLANFPAWNFVFADYVGDIGYRVVGNPFKHTEATPFGVPTMNYEQFKNVEFLDPNDRPSLLKPKRNFIYTANHRHWPLDAKYYGGRGYSMSFRGLKIHELLKNKKEHDVESLKNIQCDREATDARFFTPLLLKALALLPKKEITEKTTTLLSTWNNFETSVNCMACGIYRRWLDLLDKTWKTDTVATYRLLKKTTDDPMTEKKLLIDIENALNTASSEINNRTWGEVHLNPFKHLSMQDNHEDKNFVFSPEIPTAGDDQTIDPGTAKWNEKRKIYEHYSGSSMRMIIELKKDQPEIWLSLPGKNAQYDSADTSNSQTWKKWSECQYDKIDF
jgi:penicillin amidase